EALLRWPNAAQTIDIKALISLAKKTGIINELTLWIIDQACKTLEVLTKEGHHNHSISVNLSPKNLTIPNLIEKIENTLLKYNISAAKLQFELTESAFIEQQEEMKLFISQLKQLGINVALDDFGTDYSSLSYLLNYSFSTLKVDKSFVNDLSSNEKSQVIVKTSIEVAHNLGMNITIEGVKDKATATLLTQLGADKAQGYYYTEPLPLDKYLTWLATEHK
ncbi:MAG: EAL domain-containing protein, partial [Pseudoalteromonas sp.]